MKIILLLLLSFSAHAGYVNLASCSSGQGSDIFSSIENCEQATGSKCSVFKAKACEASKIVSEEIVTDDAKLATLEALIAAKKLIKEEKEAQKEIIKSELFALKKSDIDAMTVSQRNAVMIKLINIVQKIEE